MSNSEKEFVQPEKKLSPEHVALIEGLSMISSRERMELLLTLEGAKPASIISIQYMRKIEGTDFVEKTEGAEENSETFFRAIKSLGLKVCYNQSDFIDGSTVTYVDKKDGKTYTRRLIKSKVNFLVSQNSDGVSELEAAFALQDDELKKEDYHRSMGKAVGYSKPMIDDFVNGTDTEEGLEARRILNTNYRSIIQRESPTLYELVIQDGYFNPDRNFDPK